jgi:hypothetical protein
MGQIITACGRAFQPDPRVPELIMGVSPFELLVVLDDNAEATSLNAQMICVTGFVDQPQQAMMGVRAAMYSPQDIEIVQPARQASVTPLAGIA